MDIEITYALRFSRFLNAMIHNGQLLTKAQARAVMKAGKAKGYRWASEIPDELIDDVLKKMSA